MRNILFLIALGIFFLISCSSNEPGPAPLALDVTNQTQYSFDAQWEDLVGATNYLLDVSTSETFDSFVSGFEGLSVGEVTSYTVTRVLGDPTTYYYRVRALSEIGESSNSNVISITVIGLWSDDSGGNTFLSENVDYKNTLNSLETNSPENVIIMFEINDTDINVPFVEITLRKASTLELWYGNVGRSRDDLGKAELIFRTGNPIEIQLNNKRFLITDETDFNFVINELVEGNNLSIKITRSGQTMTLQTPYDLIWSSTILSSNFNDVYN